MDGDKIAALRVQRGFQDAIFSARGKARTCRFQSPRRAASKCLYVLLLTPAPAWPSEPSRQYSLYAISETVTGSDPLQRAVSPTKIPSQIHDRFATPHESLAFARISTFTGHFVLGCVAVDIIWSGVLILSHQIPLAKRRRLIERVSPNANLEFPLAGRLRVQVREEFDSCVAY